MTSPGVDHLVLQEFRLCDGASHAEADGVLAAAESNVVDRHIRALRAKLQNGWRRPRYIETVAGAGYRFIPEA